MIRFTLKTLKEGDSASVEHIIYATAVFTTVNTAIGISTTLS